MDSGSPKLSYNQKFTIVVNDVNEPPIDIRLSTSYIPENIVGIIGE
jgi:hypothetical protein